MAATSESKDEATRWRKLSKDLRAAVRRDRQEAMVSSLLRLVDLVGTSPNGHRHDFLNDPDLRGWTVLHLACLKNRADMVRLLLSPMLPAHEHLADLSCSEEVLARHWVPADVNAQTVEQSTPLVVAAYNGRVEVAQLLLEHGADASLLDHEGKTARDIAVARMKPDVVEVIDRWMANSSKRAAPSEKATWTTASGEGEEDELQQRATKLPRFADSQEGSEIQLQEALPSIE